MFAAQTSYFEKIKELQEGTSGAASPFSQGLTGTTGTTSASGLLSAPALPGEPISCPVASGSENDDVSFASIFYSNCLPFLILESWNK